MKNITPSGNPVPLKTEANNRVNEKQLLTRLSSLNKEGNELLEEGWIFTKFLINTRQRP